MSPRSRRGSLLAGALIASVLSVSVGPTIVGNTPMASAAEDLGAGGEFHPLPPQRIFDTRPPGINSAGAPLQTSNGGAVDIHVLGQGGVPAAAGEVLAVVLSFTVVSPQAKGFLQVYPSGSAAGTSSILNFEPNQTVPNLAVLTLGAGGNVTAKISGNVGRADVLVDVFGWFSTSTSGSRGARLIPTSPGRIFDSREGVFRAGARPFGQGESVELQIRGADAKNPDINDIVPDSGEVTGVVLNVTGINDIPGASNTFISVLPENPSGPVSTSNLNLVPGQVKANLVIVPVGADGKVRLYNNAGNAHIAVDVVGYMRGNQASTTRVGRVIPLTAPFRSFDTREAAFGNVPLGAGQSETWSFSQFVASVTLNNVPVGNQVALIGNLTGTGLARTSPTIPAATFFTLYPGEPRPFSSNINVTEGVDIPNLAVVKLSADNSIQAYNNAGNMHYVFDVAAVVLND